MSFCPASAYQNLSEAVGLQPVSANHEILSDDLIRSFVNELEELGIGFGDACEHSISEEAFVTLLLNYTAFRVIDDFASSAENQ